MAQIVELPNGDNVEFPDGMSLNEMQSHISKRFPHLSPENQKDTGVSTIAESNSQQGNSDQPVGTQLTKPVLDRALDIRVDSEYNKPKATPGTPDDTAPKNDLAKLAVLRNAANAKRSLEAANGVDSVVGLLNNGSDLTQDEELAQNIAGHDAAKALALDDKNLLLSQDRLAKSDNIRRLQALSQSDSINTNPEEAKKIKDQLEMARAEYAAAQDKSNLYRGAKATLIQMPQLASGLLAGAGAAGEVAFGKDGISTALKDIGIESYSDWSKKSQINSKENDSLTTAYSKAKNGDIGALSDWLGYGLGYIGGQAAQMLATAGAGGATAKILGLGSAKIAEGMVAKESAEILSMAAGKKLGAEELAAAAAAFGINKLEKMATANVATKIGQTAVIGAQAFGMEGGEIFGDLVSQAHTDGRDLTGADLGRALGYTIAAGTLEFVGDKLGFDAILGKSKFISGINSAVGAKGAVARAAAGGIAVGAAEATQEGTQTIAEELGKGNDPFTDAGLKNIIDSAGLGALGAAHGVIGGLRQAPQRSNDAAEAGNIAALREAAAINEQLQSEGISKISTAPDNIDSITTAAMGAVNVEPVTTDVLDATASSSAARDKLLDEIRRVNGGQDVQNIQSQGIDTAQPDNGIESGNDLLVRGGQGSGGETAITGDGNTTLGDGMAATSTGIDSGAQGVAAQSLDVQKIQPLGSDLSLIEQAVNDDILSKENEKITSDNKARIQRGETAAELLSDLGDKSVRLVQVDEVNLKHIPTEQKLAIRLIASVFGKKVSYLADADGKDLGFHGLYGANIGANENTIYLDAKGDHTLMRVVGHEIAHALRVQAPDVYATLEQELTPLLGDGLAKRQLEKRDYGSKEQISKNFDKPGSRMKEETIADMIGDKLTDSKFLLDLATKMTEKKAKTMFGHLKDIVGRAISAVKSAPLSTQTVGVLRDADAAIAKAMAAYKNMIDSGEINVKPVKQGNEDLGLTSIEKDVSDRFEHDAATHTDQLMDRYIERNGLVVDADKVKELSPDFKADKSLAAAVHETSSWLSKKIFTKMLNEHHDMPVIFTAGGGGSGKTEAMPVALRGVGLKESDAIVFDSTLSSFNSAVEKIDEALESGRVVYIVYTNTHVTKAAEFAFKRERVVSIKTLAKAHVDASNVIRELVEFYKDNDNVFIRVVNNPNAISDIANGSIDNVFEYEYNDIERSLYEQAKRQRANGDLSEERFATLGRGIQEEVGGKSGQVQGREQGQEPRGSGVGSGSEGESGVSFAKKDASERKGRTLDEVRSRVANSADLAVSKDLQHTIDGKEFSSLDHNERGPGLLIDNPEAAMKLMMEKAILESGLPLDMAKGIKLPTVEYVNKAFELSNGARFWYELSADGFSGKFFKLTKSLTDRLIDVVAGTSGGQKPTDNMRVAVAGIAQDLQGLPVTVGVRDPSSLTKALSPESLATHKFGNFSDTMQIVAGLRNVKPLPTIDLQMAAVFGIKHAEVASNPVMYETISRFIIKLRDAQNAKLGKGEQPYESWQMQALLWVAERGTTDPDSYNTGMPKIVAQLKDAGIPLPGGKITIETLMDPRTPEALAPTSKAVPDAHTVTLETRTMLTKVGESSTKAFNAIKNIDEPWAKKIAAEFDSIQRRAMKALGNRQQNPDGVSKSKVPSVLSQLMAVIADKSPGSYNISRIDTDGMGTFEGDASPNMRIPMLLTGAVKTELTEAQRLQFLSVIGKDLKQAASAASVFKSVEHGSQDTFSVLLKRYDKADITEKDLTDVSEKIGRPINFSKVPNGWLFDINVGGFDKVTDAVAVHDAFVEVIGNEKDLFVIPREYSSDYVEGSDYAKHIKELENGITANINTGASGSNGRTEKRNDNFIAIRKQIRGIAAEQERQFSEWESDARAKAEKHNISFSRKESTTGSTGDASSIRVEPTEVNARHGKSKNGSDSVLGIHYSANPRTVVSGYYYGKGLRGGEARRLQNSEDERIKQRIHFYINEGNGISPESGVGGFIHGLHLDNIYNTATDKLGIRKSAAGDSNLMESRIIDAGFDGYYVPQVQGKQGVAVLLGDHGDIPVEFLGTKESIQRMMPYTEEQDHVKDELVKFSRKQTNTPEFKKWFGDSKVIDTLGNPLVVYHGTRKSFDAFDINHGGARTASNSGMDGFFFTSSTSSAQLYAYNGPYGGDNIIPAYLALKNPRIVQRVKGEDKNLTEITKDVEIAQAKKDGNDGVIFKGYIDSPRSEGGVADTFAVFNPAQIKSAIGNNGNFDQSNHDIRFSRKKKSPFYSQLERGIETANDKIFTNGKQVKAWLESNSGRLLIQKKEIYWTGIGDWLDTQGKVSKADVLAFVKGNGVQIEETELGNITPEILKVEAARDKAHDAQMKLADAVTEQYYSDPVISQVSRANMSWWSREAARGDAGAMDKLNSLGFSKDRMKSILAYGKAFAKYDDLRGEAAALRAGLDTVYSNHTLPGGENYREVILTIPHKEDFVDTYAVRGAFPRDGFKTREDAQNYINKFTEMAGKEEFIELSKQVEKFPFSIDDIRVDKNEGDSFIAPHFKDVGVKNIIAHIRFNERTDVDGKKVLFLEELQSDAQQATRDGKDIKKMPFTDTKDPKSVTALSLKRMIAYAVENEFDKIAWTTGEQQSERYDLSKQIGSISTKEYAGRVTLTVNDSEGNYIAAQSFSNYDDPAIADYVGKDLAKKIIDDVSKSKHQPNKTLEYSGLDLKVGGEGMKGYYDEIVPQVANSILRNSGGGKVAPVSIDLSKQDGNHVYTVNTRDGRVLRAESLTQAKKLVEKFGGKVKLNEQQGFEITPELKSKVETDGLPLFSRKQSSLPEETDVDASQRVIQDKMIRFKVVRDFIAEQGKALSEAADVWRHEGNMYGKIATRSDDFRNLQVKPLIERTEKAGFTMDQVSTYLEMQHIPEANARMRQIHNDPDATANGVTDIEAKQALRDFQSMKNFADLKGIADEWRSITESTRDILVNSGIIGQDMADSWKATYKNYVPLKGDEEATGTGTGKGLSVNGKTKRRLGHGERNEAIIANILRDHERAINLSEKNAVGFALIQMAVELNDPSIISIGNPVKRQVYKAGQQHYVVTYNGVDVAAFDNLNDARNYKAWSGQLKGVSSAMLGMRKTSDPATVALMASPMLADNEVNVYVNGHTVRIQINDELLARAYTNMGVEHLNQFMMAMKDFNRWLSIAYTGYNPQFILKNMARDMWAGVINLTGDYGVGMAAKIYANYPKAMFELSKSLNDPRKSADVLAYRAAGGSTGAAYLSDIDRIGADVMDSYNEYAGGVDTYSRVYNEEIANGRSKKYATMKATAKASKAVGAGMPLVGHLLTAIEHMNAVTENALRLATFTTLKAEGYSDASAAQAAKLSTVNFNRKGELTAQAGALYLFFNPNIQGTHRIIYALNKSEHKHQAQALVGMMVAGAYLIAQSMRGGDDEKRKKWEQLPQHIKDTNLVFNAGKLQATVPLPYGYAMFWAMGNALSDIQNGESKSKVAIRLSDAMFNNFSPTGNPMEAGEPSFFDMAPTAGKMILSPELNKNSWGRELTPEKVNDAQPDSQNMYRNTKGTVYAHIAEGLNEVTGGNLYKKGIIDISPETIKYWVSSLTGGSGATLIDTSILGQLMAQDTKPELSEIPILRTFVREPGIADARQEYYHNMKEMKVYADQFALAVKDKNGAAAHEMVDESRPEIRLAKMADAHRKALASYADAIDEIRQNKSLSMNERRLREKEVELKQAVIYECFRVAFEINKKQIKD